MSRRWSNTLQFFSLAVMVAFGSFIIISILTVMNYIAQMRIYG